MNRNDKLDHLRRLLAGKISRFLPAFNVRSLMISYKYADPTYLIECSAVTQEQFDLAREQWENLPEEKKIIVNVIRQDKSKPDEPGKLDRKIFFKSGN